MKKSTREWVKKAEQDYVLAVQGSRSEVPVHDGVCFHCQQCAEKYLKGLMEELGLAVPKTRNRRGPFWPLCGQGLVHDALHDTGASDDVDIFEVQPLHLGDRDRAHVRDADGFTGLYV